MMSRSSHPCAALVSPLVPSIGRRLRTRCYLLIAVAGLALLGCQQEGIETHRVLRPPPPPPPEEKVRLLGAMIPHEKNTWFFKLVGPVEAVEKQKAAFDSFIG